MNTYNCILELSNKAEWLQHNGRKQNSIGNRVVDNYNYDDLINLFNTNKTDFSLYKYDIRLSDDPFRLCTEEEKLSILKELYVD